MSWYDGLALQAGQIKEAASEHRTANAVIFFVRVLTAPLPFKQENADLILKQGWIPLPEKPETRDYDTPLMTSKEAPRIMFRGRIIKSNNGLRPHILIRDPCRVSVGKNLNYIYKLLQKHTLFISKKDYYGKTPQIGDVVQVALQRGDFKGPDLQAAHFDEIIDSSQAEIYNFQNLVDCESLKAKMEGSSYEDSLSEYSGGDFIGEYDISSHAGADALAKKYLTKLRAESSTPKQYTGTDSTGTTYELTKCGAPGKGSYGSKACKEFAFTDFPSDITDEFPNIEFSLTLHPKFGGHIIKALTDYFTEIAKLDAGHEDRIDMEETRTQPINPYGARTTQDTIRLRLQNGCGTDYQTIMENPSKKCNIAVAPPGQSNHETGLAIDLSGILTNWGDRGAALSKNSSARTSHFYKWMIKNVHNESKYGNIKNWTYSNEEHPGEPWHWSWNGK